MLRPANRSLHLDSGYAVNTINSRLTPPPSRTLCTEIHSAVMNLPPLNAKSYALKVKSMGKKVTLLAFTAHPLLNETASKFQKGKMQIRHVEIRNIMLKTIKTRCAGDLNFMSMINPFYRKVHTGTKPMCAFILEHTISRIPVGQEVRQANKHGGYDRFEHAYCSAE